MTNNTPTTNNGTKEDTQISADSVKKELTQIHEQLNTLNQHKFIRVYNSTSRLLWFQFLRGIAFGLGSVAGATIIVSLLISLLAQVEFIPIIGEWAQLLMKEIQVSNPQ